MATQIIEQTSLQGASYYLTSLLSSIHARTDKLKVDVSIVYDPDGVIDTFYSTTLYAFNGMVELDDVGSLIEEYFRQHSHTDGPIEIIMDGQSLEFHVLYCECSMPDDFDPAKSFFVATKAQRVHQDSIVTIAGINHGSATPFVIKAVGHDAEGVPRVVERSVNKDLGNGFVYFFVPEIIRWALNQTDYETGADLVDVMYFSIEYAGVQKMFYIVPAPAYLTFCFRNNFNVEEYIDVVGEMTTKTDVDRSEAVCGGVSRQYDRVINRTYQVQTEPLTPEEVTMFEQFICSHSVSLMIGPDDYPVIITDHTCEPSTDDETLTSIKFTWRFSDRRPRIFDLDFNGIMPSRRQIFTEQFSPEYE